MNNQVYLQAIFVYLDDLLHALRALKERKLDIRAVHSPAPNHEIEALMEEKPSLIISSNHVGLVGFAREYFQFLWDSSDAA